MKNPFQVGETYRNDKGDYEVLRIDGPTMVIRWTDSQAWQGPISLQARIWERIQDEERRPPEPSEPPRPRYTRLAAKAYHTKNAAVFSRNHRKYLQGAVQVGVENRTREITFRGRTAWKSAAAAVAGKGPRPLYYAVVDEGPLVRYEALLCQVAVDPGPALMRELLELCLESTQDEGMWDGTVSTLYTISGCHKLAEPFPFTALTKLSDGCHLAGNFGYSYAIVLAYCHRCRHSPCLCGSQGGSEA